jgi:chorismate mutase/prephenate dehydrogenase
MRLVGDVADAKLKAGLPSFDRDREGAHLDALSDQGREAGLPLDVVRDVFGILFAASRHEQRLHLYPRADHFSVGVIGGTAGMGAFLARVFISGGHDVEMTGLDAGDPSVVVAARHDLVVIAVPIAATVEVIREVAPHIRSGACLMDVTSLKRAPLEAMLRFAPSDVAVVGSHPMFGPHGADFDRQKVVLCRGRGDNAFDRVRRLYESFGAEVIEADADEHDRHMALIQVLVHEKTMVLGSVLERMRADLGRSLQFASPIYRTELAMIGRMFSQGAALYADILTSNPDGARVCHLFEQESAHFARAVAMSDRAAVVSRFEQIAAFMTDFAAWARKESDAILHDLLRHG